MSGALKIIPQKPEGLNQPAFIIGFNVTHFIKSPVHRGWEDSGPLCKSLGPESGNQRLGPGEFSASMVYETDPELCGHGDAQHAYGTPLSTGNRGAGSLCQAALGDLGLGGKTVASLFDLLFI